MTDVTPAGWYPDNAAPGHQRWWDGAQWTEHVQAPYAAGASRVALKAPEGTSPHTVQIWLIVGLFILQGVTSVVWLASFDWSGYMSSSLDSSLSGSLAGPYAMLFTPGYLAMMVVSFVAYAATVALAFFDTKALEARGVVRPFHWAFSFIPSYGSTVYVIGRSIVARRRTGSGMSPLWIYIIAFVVTLIATFIAMFAGMSSMMSNFPSPNDFGYYGE